MKTKNQTEQHLLELAVAKAANEDGISPPSRDNGRDNSRDVAAPIRAQAWSPLEVWRTRVKTPAQSRTESPQIQG
jgi:hypothetical protein